MIKHADMLDIWRNHQKAKRNKELRPAWWANATLPVADVAINFPNRASLFAKAPESAYTHSIDEIADIIAGSGLDVTAGHRPAGRLARLIQRKFPDFQKYLYRARPGHGSDPASFGTQGRVTQMGHEPAERWHIPALTQEIGHAEEEHAMGPIPKLLQRSRGGFAAAGLLGGAVDSLRALGNKERPIAERKQLLNRASGIAGAGMAPTLINEFRASRNGLNLLKKLPLEGKAGILEEAGRMYPRAFSTYALMAAAPVLAPQIAKMFLPKHVD